MTVLDKLLNDIDTDWTVTTVDVGENWILSQVRHTDGRKQAGVAASPRSFSNNAKFPVGTYRLAMPANDIIHGLRTDEPTASAVGLATLNAVNAPDSSLLTTEDAADWLSEKTRARSIAIFGRFPFIKDEIRPFAKNVFVFEQTPQDDEYTAKDMPQILPQADIIAITGTTIINNTIDDILQYTTDKHTVIVLGPSTPLTTQLFELGVDVLFGVRVADVDAVKKSVHAHLGFQKVQGLQRVSLFKNVHHRGTEKKEKRES